MRTSLPPLQRKHLGDLFHQSMRLALKGRSWKRRSTAVVSRQTTMDLGPCGGAPHDEFEVRTRSTVDLLVAWAVENLAPPFVHPTLASRASPAARHGLLDR